MRVLAIDPGYDRLGLAILDKDVAGVVTYIYSTCVLTDRTSPHAERLTIIGSALRKAIQTYRPHTLAIETLFFNKNIKTALLVAEARGVILYEATQGSCSIHELSPQAIKIALTGYGKSDKQAVTAMVKRLIRGVPTSALDDEYDAIAIGMTHLAQNGTNR